MASIPIRPAAASDIPAITRIYADAVVNGTASFEIDPPDEAEMMRRMRQLLDNNFVYIAAEIDGAFAGYAYAGPYRSRPAYRWTIEDSVYIAPQMQGRGIGRALLDRLIVDSEARGFRQMMAVIGDSVKQLPSIALHAAAGFHHAGTLENVGFKHGRWLDSVLMQRPLGDAATTNPQRN